jgi:hypothetical protein
MKITDMFQKAKESEKLDPNEELISFLFVVTIHSILLKNQHSTHSSVL